MLISVFLNVWCLLLLGNRNLHNYSILIFFYKNIYIYVLPLTKIIKAASDNGKKMIAKLFIKIAYRVTNSVSASVIFLSGFVPSRSHHEVSEQNTIKCHRNSKIIVLANKCAFLENMSSCLFVKPFICLFQGWVVQFQWV